MCQEVRQIIVTMKETGNRYRIRYRTPKPNSIRRRCFHCLKLIEDNSELAYMFNNRTLHIECVEKAIRRREIKFIRTAELATGGNATTYHERGGRVIRGTNST